MPQIEYNGMVHEFPDDFSDADISAALMQLDNPGGSLTSSGNEAQDIASQQGSAHLFDVAKGFGKGALNTVYQGGDLIRRGLGMERVIDTPEVQAATQPASPEQALGAKMETAAELIPAGVGVLKAGAKVPGIMARAAGMSKPRAAANLASAADAAKDVVLNVEGPGQAALRIVELGERGGSVPRVVQTFMRRITDPSKGPLTFEEARDYYSNISRLSSNEFGRLNPTVQRAVGDMRVALQTALKEAAGTVGKADEYTSGIREYAKASKAQEFVSDKAPDLVKRILGAMGLGAAASVGYKLLD